MTSDATGSVAEGGIADVMVATNALAAERSAD
jgi:hypothetical protein